MLIALRPESPIGGRVVGEGRLAGVGFPVEPAPRRKDEAPLALSLSLSPENATVSAYEPVLAQVTLTNNSGETAELWQVGSLDSRWQVRDARGRLVAVTPRQLFPGDLCYSVKELKPGASLTSTAVVSALYTFATPGEYGIRLQRLRVTPLFPVIAETSVRVRVLPFDAQRLTRRCADLAPWHAQKYSTWETSLSALCSVRHEIALPYLDELARRECFAPAMRAMLRIGSPKARELFRVLTERHDSVGKVARQVRDAPPPYRWQWPEGVL